MQASSKVRPGPRSCRPLGTFLVPATVWRCARPCTGTQTKDRRRRNKRRVGRGGTRQQASARRSRLEMHAHARSFVAPRGGGRARGIGQQDAIGNSSSEAERHSVTDSATCNLRPWRGEAGTGQRPATLARRPSSAGLGMNSSCRCAPQTHTHQAGPSHPAGLAASHFSAVTAPAPRHRLAATLPAGCTPLFSHPALCAALAHCSRLVAACP